ncbi:non-ribosomal peptide synthetase [Hyalangium rubrum]|uniref:Amino acid adenylation domain-containing protein n=1 Tax=Hyalangium rubrum TaxID=3103134 RepID=A0ABU5GVK8_9BACT|nr:non-ribosomal peptide synthetase [Hyalangium sp. s54d21]MDY7225116.1 amino acid adenylation domain-containing protein [Hyalangium sp. s54d21]
MSPTPEIRPSPLAMTQRPAVDSQQQQQFDPDEVFVFPMSFGQRRLWLAEQLSPGSAVYHLPVAIRLTGPLQASALEQALRHIVERHETLRTTFATVEDQPVQVIHPAREHTLEREDLSTLPAAERERALEALAEREGLRPFELGRGPLLRTRLVRLSDTEHVLLLAMHHLIADGWSALVLVRELGALYGALARGQAPTLPELPIQYADFTAWQAERLTGEALEKLVGYWRQRLTGSPALLALPTDLPRPAVRGHLGASQPVALPKRLIEALRVLAREEGCSLYMVLLAAFQTLLYRQSGQSDIVVGSPMAHRQAPGTEGLIGYFVDMLPLRVDLSGNPTFRALLRRVREVALEAYSHQELPLEKVLEAVAPRRGAGHTPLFQAILALTEAAGEQLSLAGLDIRISELDTRTAKFDLSLLLEEGREGIRGRLEYSTELFASWRMEALVQQWVALLEDAAARPDARIDRLQMMGAEERQRVLALGRGAASPYPREATLGQLFEQQARATPDAVAVEFGEERVSYAELDARANALAHRLRERGVGPEVVVALAAQRSVEFVVGMLGILKAGGAYLPVDPATPERRLRFMLEEAGARGVLAQRRWLERLPEVSAPVWVLEDEARERRAEAPARADGAEHLAYVMFTSGSTGKPKGVAVNHRGVIRLVRGSDCLEFSSSERILLFSAVAFDASTLEIWGALLNGGTLVVAPPHLLGFSELAALLERARISTLWLTAGLFHQMVDAHPEALVGVRQLIAGGDALSPPHVKRLLELRRGGALINGYGPTENTTFTSCHRMEPGASVGASVPLGRPIAQTDLFILDGNLEPVPLGVVGELYTSGDGLARGYVGRPELTAERFVPHPFSQKPGDRLYRTGDLARLRPDGVVEFFGRADTQVKLRGFRIETGEIEAVLCQHPAVKEAVVGVRGAGEDKRLVAYFTSEARPAPDAAVLKAWLASQLPEYMVPTAFVGLEALPLNASGKVDRAALPEPTGVVLQGERVAPRTPVEERLAELWRALLGIQEVGVHDNFFELGGHSLLATQLGSRIRQVFSVELPLRALFEAPTIAEQAARVQVSSPEASGPALPPLVPVSREQDLPPSFAQQRLWLLDQLDPGSPLYNIAGAVRMSGRLDVEALTLSLGGVVARHEALRTSFVSRAGEPFLKLHPPMPLPLVTRDLSALPEAERLAEARRQAAEWAQLPFDLSRPPLLRALLLRLGAEEHRLVLSVHHIVSDGWSLGVLIQEVATLYGAVLSGQPAALAPLPFQYADFAQWQRSWLQGERLQQLLAYWKQQLIGAPDATDLPLDRPRPAVQSFKGELLLFTLSPRLTDSLRALSQRQGATLFMTLFSAFNVLLSRYTGQEDLVVGTTIAHRTRAELEGLIGFFVNTLAIRTDLSGAPRFVDLLGRVKQTLLAAYAHQDAPFDQVVDALQPVRDLSRTPLFQVMFDLINTPRRELALPELTLRAEQAETGTSKFDFSVQMEEVDGGLLGTVEYNTELFERGTMERMVRHFEHVLEELLATPEAPVAHLSLLTPQEWNQQIIEWNRTEHEWESLEPFPVLFERQVDRTPEAIAVTCAGRALTYAQLDGLANRVAHVLRARGVGPEDIVAVLQERDIEYLVCMLGIFKAGAAYVPLDPVVPKPRLASIVEQSRCRLVLTEARYRELAQALQPDGVLDIREVLQAGPAERLPCLISGRHMAYLLFTSGSTGTPKGAMLEHEGMLNHALAMARQMDVTAADGMAQSARQSFDVSVWQFLATLLAGGRICILQDHVVLDPDLLLERIVSDRVTLIELVPTQLNMLLGSIEAQGAQARVASVLRWMVSTGEALMPELASRWFRSFPNLPLLNAYGPTECSDDVTCNKVYEPPARTWAAVPIHGTLENLRVYVLDAGLRPLPIGAAGELCIGGLGVGRGYMADPAKTANVFVPDPFSEEPGMRLYRTGDRVRYLPNGAIEYLGRVDHQVKIRGVRIETGEIESVLATHPRVHECVVMARTDTPGEKQLVGYVSPRGEGVPDERELRRFLKDRLPPQMVPAAIVILEALPLLPNGKVNRRALPAPTGERSRLVGSVAPRTPVEQKLAAIWAQVLRLESVGVEDNFFELGGHSLMATQVISRAREALGVELPVRSLFESPTVAGLAQRAQQLLSQGGPVGVPPPVTPVPREGTLPLSYAQVRLWVLEQFEPGSAVYNIPGALRMRGQLDVDALERSFNEILARHESLRCVFREEQGAPVQVVIPSLHLPLPVVELSDLDAEVREQEVQRLGTEEAQRGFELSQGPLVRARLLRLGPTEHVLLLTMHHIVSDGWSVGVFLKELGALYEAFSQGKPSPLPPLPIQYMDYAVWQRKWLQGETLDTLMRFWKQRLTGVEPLDLKTDRPRSAAQGANGMQRSSRLSRELTEGLRALSQKRGATLFMTLLAGFKVLLWRYTRQEDLTVGTPVANRNRAEVEGLIGFFINTLVLRNEVSGEEPFTELLDRVRLGTVEAYAHQEAPFDRVVEAVQPERDLTRTPLFQVMFELQNIPDETHGVRLPGLELVAQELGTGTAKFDLMFTLSEAPEGLTVGVEYDADLFDAETIERMVRHFEVLLSGIVARPEVRLSDLPLLREAEEHALRASWARPERDTGLERFPELQMAARKQGVAPRAYVLDAWLRPVPPGVPGELCLGGWPAGASVGSEDAARTADTFVPDPLSTEPEARMVRTGELVREGPQGELEFLGKVQPPARRRSSRLDIGEGEALLREHPAVADCVLVSRTVGLEQHIVAYVVGREGQPKPSPEALEGYLASRLPRERVPASYMLLDTLPRTPDGKVDRTALPVPEGELDDGYTAPRTPTEERLATLWQELLGVSRVGVYDNFFDLGGHSLVAVQILSRIRKEFQAELPVTSLFEDATVAGLAARLEAAGQSGPEFEPPPLVAISRYEE